MRIINVLTERKVLSLNRPFSYSYDGDKNIECGVRVLVEFKNVKLIGYVIEVKDLNISLSEYEKETGYKINPILEIIDEKPLLNDELMKLSKAMSEYYIAPLISVLQAMLPLSLRPSSSSLKAPKIAYEQYLVIVDDNEEDLTPKQLELFRLIKKNIEVNKRDLKSKIHLVNSLIEKRKIKIIKKEKNRLVIPEYQKENIKTLTFDQINAIENIVKTDKIVSLLQGVTGSGKTEIYLSLTEKTLNEGKSVIILVPEISLTPIMVEYFQRRFKDNIAIFHSGLTNAEKYDEYRKILKGNAKVVIGVRSAIFAPVNNLGLIILDEEQVESYKQDCLPYYHARDIAIYRAKVNNAKVVLGSATPSLESKSRALKDVYNLVKLEKRINQKELPKTTIVDLSKGYNLTRESYIFSKLLIEKIKEKLDKHEQIILLINRRGYSGFLSCRNCGHIFMCPNCNVALTYHKEDNMLKCHHCGHVEIAPNLCPICGSKYFMHNGFGSEKVISEINKLFPKAKVLRLDSDISEVRNNIPKVIKAFSNHEADILVGTQMIAKGHDFPNVTLVGVLLADLGLSIPSYRSSERTYELITQAVGRSGRSNKTGEAIIQTYNPKNLIINYAARQDYDGFYKYEMNIRKVGKYPPYRYLISLEILSKDEQYVDKILNKIVEDINLNKFEDVDVIGPTIPYIPKENEYYRRLILIKYKNSDKIKNYVERLSTALSSTNKIKIKINVDPYTY